MIKAILDEQQLKAVCDVLAETKLGYTKSELTRLLKQSGIEIVSDGKTSSVYGYTPGLNKRDWLYNCLATDINKRHNLMYVYIFIEKALNPVAFTDERKRDQYNYLFEGVNKALLRRENIPNKVKTVAELSRQDGTAFGMYITLYNEGSKFEHSEISKTKKYRKKVIDGYTEDQVFTIDLGSSNKDEWFTVFRYSLMCVFFAFSSLYERIKTRENHLFDESPNGKIYLRESFEQIHLKLFCCMQMLEKAEQNIDE